MHSLSLSTSVDDAVFFLAPDPWTFAELLCDDSFVADSVVVSDFHPVQPGLDNPSASRPHVDQVWGSDTDPTDDMASTQSPIETSTPLPAPAKSKEKKRATEKKPSPWTNEEQKIFLAGLACFECEKTRVAEDGHVSVGLGPGVARMIAGMIGTRNASQVRSHAQKHFHRLSRQQGLC